MTEKSRSWNSLKKEAPKWFCDAKFGLFFHWGPYSVPACENEWYSRNMYTKGLSQNKWHVDHYGPLSEFGYKDFIPMFKGEAFDPDEWADLVVKSGAKYAGPVTEHADNYSLWNSAINPINSVKTGPKRDIAGECARTFRQRGIKFLATFHHQWLWGWFMSTDSEADVYDPKNEVYYGPALPLETNRYMPYRLPDAAFNNTWAAKVKEVVEKYGPDIVYFDSRANIISDEAKQDMLSFYYEKNRQLDGIITYKQEDFPADVGIYDVEIGGFDSIQKKPWQTDDRLEDNVTWCIVQEPRYKNAREIIHQLCDVVSKNGNLLLNIGPKADGSFHPEAKKQLFAIGDWLEICGEAIYGTRPWKIAAEGPTGSKSGGYDINLLKKQLREGIVSDKRNGLYTAEDFRFTAGAEACYAIALGWPGGGKWEVHSMNSGDMPQISRVSLVGGGSLAFEQGEKALTVYAPAQKPFDHAWPLKIE
jgi:alpha-L-fucosidase